MAGEFDDIRGRLEGIAEELAELGQDSAEGADQELAVIPWLAPLIFH